jgi:hypothetical protein
MLLFGGLLGAGLGYVFIALPAAVALASVLAATFVPPLVPLFSASLATMMIVHAVVILVLYVLAVSGTTIPPTGLATVGPLENFSRGAMIGINAAVNYQVSVVVLIATGNLGLAPLMGPYLGVVNFLSCVPGFAGNAVYQAFLGWSSWAMPCSWLATLVVGLPVFVLNALGWFFGVPFRPFVEWWTGTVVVHGGWVYPFWLGGPVAWNVGNFSFVDPRFSSINPTVLPGGGILGTVEGVTYHETGHTLNVAALGPWFHYIGAIEENIFPPLGGAGANAYAELAAESNRQASLPRAWLPLWAPSIAVVAPTGNAAPAAVASATPGVGTIGSAINVSGAPPPGSPSFDVDSYPMGSINPGVIPASGVLWLLTAPAGSLAVVAAPNSVNSSFIPDFGGDYAPLLVVTDGADIGFASTGTVSILGAQANGPYAGLVGDPIPVSAGGTDGGSLGSLPPTFGPALALVWAVVSAPPGAIASFDNPASATPNFTADTAGVYTISLSATEPGGLIDMDTAEVTVS